MEIYRLSTNTYMLPYSGQETSIGNKETSMITIATTLKTTFVVVHLLQVKCSVNRGSYRWRAAH